MDKHTYLGNIGVEMVESLYQDFLRDPASVEESWQQFFKGFEFARINYTELPGSGLVFDKEFKVISLITDYRQRGHLFTKTNPVRTRRSYTPDLSLQNYGLDDADLDTVFQAGNEIGIGPATLRDIVAHLQMTYCRTIGVEYMYIRTPEVVKWLQKKMEEVKNTPSFSAEQKKHIYFNLKIAVGFEKYIHKKFVGQKRFSLEGAESLIPALDSVIDYGAELGIEEFVIGMSHRGRLNVLANVLNKPYVKIFEEFTGKSYTEDNLLGDVKYHMGYENTIETETGKQVRLSLVPNPSHLETVGGVASGIARGMITHKYNNDYSKLAPIIIHGDAAISSQGVVYEVIQMSQVEGYKTGGTIHLVINNQVGFTTNYLEGRSSTYCTDIGKVIKAPVFHVNGDDPEALAYTIELAVEYRQKFHTDVFIDLLCYRKYGHNEGDEPRFTQPLLYKEINKHPNVRDIYAKKLIAEGVMTEAERSSAEELFDSILDEALERGQSIDTVEMVHFLGNEWKAFRHPEKADFFKKIDTGVNRKTLLEIADKINTLPENKKFFSKIDKLLKSRIEMIENDQLDWAICEHLAYGSLLLENYPVRISGQDSIRGTFSHRHAAYVEEDTGERYFPLKNLSARQAPFEIYNSTLSEYGVMGFEYGFALATPGGLTIWEAQFGDFVNVAQVIIDQYISSAVEKWGLMNGLVLYLPHGYEGQGPEHSSARIERFLALCANNNMQVLNCTTPSNLFHALRRQTLRDFKVPMVIFTPKSLLRHPDCVSTMDDLENGSFMEVIDDQFVDPEKVTQVAFSFGKIYFDLSAYRAENAIENVAIIRIEQLYPFPFDIVKDIIAKYKNATTFVWVQDEPINMGPWSYINRIFNEVPLLPIARPPASSPAGGLMEQHNKRLQKIIEKTFKKCTCDLSENYCGQRCQVLENEKRKKYYGYI